jgi:hypothetical protein
VNSLHAGALSLRSYVIIFPKEGSELPGHHETSLGTFLKRIPEEVVYDCYKAKELSTSGIKCQHPKVISNPSLENFS